MQQTCKLCLPLFMITHEQGDWDQSLSSPQAWFALSDSHKEPSNLTHEWNPIYVSVICRFSPIPQSHSFSSFFGDGNTGTRNKELEALESCWLNKQRRDAEPKQTSVWPLQRLGRCDILLTVIAVGHSMANTQVEPVGVPLLLVLYNHCWELFVLTTG